MLKQKIDLFMVAGKSFPARPIHGAPGVIVPPPPKLQDDLDDAALVLALFRNLASALRGKLRIPKHTALLQRKDFAQLLEAGRVLQSLGIRPKLWAEYSIGLYRLVSQKEDASPTPGWVFSRKRILVELDKFKAAYSSPVRGVVMSDSHRAWIRAWDKMHTEAAALPDPNRQELLNVFYKHFPGDYWERWEAQANQDTQALQRSIKENLNYLSGL